MSADPDPSPVRLHRQFRPQPDRRGAAARLRRRRLRDLYSAGTESRNGVNPFAVRVLDEIGIDWSGARSKSVTEFIGRPFDYVITVCDRARQTCPVFPGEHNTLHWGLDDPAEVEGTDARSSRHSAGHEPRSPRGCGRSSNWRGAAVSSRRTLKRIRWPRSRS
jgi:hypothetical protein